MKAKGNLWEQRASFEKNWIDSFEIKKKKHIFHCVAQQSLFHFINKIHYMDIKNIFRILKALSRK